MKFLIITHVEHQFVGKDIFAYAPYVSEMNLWIKHADKVTLIAPQTNKNKSLIDLHYNHSNFNFKEVPSIQFTDLKNAIFSTFRIPIILYSIFKACKNTDHIHLRCPGNIGLLGCIVQMFFPSKIKTAKYAGNWDPKSKQPLSYRFQKWILSNTLLTKNIQVLVYGNWKNQTKNIRSFFTASFNNSEIEIPMQRNYKDKINFVFVGSLVKGKRPLLAIKIVEKLKKEGKNVSLTLYGDGILKDKLQEYIKTNKLENIIILKGNKEKEIIKEVLKKAHFLILPSKSEGWPKAVAEAMFFGAIPIVTPVSCVPYMLDYGNRGILLEPHLEKAVNCIKLSLNNSNHLKKISNEAVKWSQKYTLDVFEYEIIKLLKI